MGEFLEKILNLLTAYFKTKQKYEWRFYSLNGSEESNQLKISNSIEYEFINSGNSIVILNDVLKIYPYFMGRAPHTVKFITNKNEVDVNVYEYRFIPIAATELTASVATSLNFHAAEIGALNAPPLNQLQVIVKQVSRQ